MKRLISLSAIIFCCIFAINAQENDSVYHLVDKKAEFPGGDRALMNWLNENIKYPEFAYKNNIQGKVYVNFIVRENGSIDSVKIARGVHSSLDNEAIRLVKAMPKWKPGLKNGVAVKSYFTLPVTFVLKEDKSKTKH